MCWKFQTDNIQEFWQIFCHSVHVFEREKNLRRKPQRLGDALLELSFFSLFQYSERWLEIPCLEFPPCHINNVDKKQKPFPSTAAVNGDRKFVCLANNSHAHSRWACLQHSVAEIVGATQKERKTNLCYGISDAHKSLKLQNGKQPGQLLLRKNKLLKSYFLVQIVKLLAKLCDGCLVYIRFLQWFLGNDIKLWLSNWKLKRSKRERCHEWKKRHFKTSRKTWIYIAC